MFTRSAILKGRIKTGQEDAFYRVVEDHLIPAWRQMLHAQAVRVYRHVAAEPGLAEVLLVQEIDYPSRDAIDEALASPRRNAAIAAMALLRDLYEGEHQHIIYQRL